MRLPMFAGVIAAGVLLSGCGTGQGGATQAESDQYLSLLAIVKGTATQINAGQYVEERTYQNGFAGCMAEAGFEYPQRPFMPPEPDADVSVRLGTEWLEPPAGDLDIAEFKVAQRFASRDWKGSPYYDLAPDQQEAYDKALDGCLKHEASWTVDSLPHSVSVVRNALFMLVEQVEAGLDTSGYGPCMKAQGFDVSSYSELYRYVATQLPPSSQAPQSIVGGDEGWRAGVALERQAAEADAECRGDIYAKGVAALGDELPAFEERFADDIATIPTEWSTLVAEADQLAPNGHCARCRVE